MVLRSLDFLFRACRYWTSHQNSATRKVPHGEQRKMFSRAVDALELS
jgi:hypothetical protein